MKNRLLLGASACLLLGLDLGCVTGGAKPGKFRTVNDVPALRARANRLWTAKLKEDWDVVYEYFEPTTQERTDKVEFAAWSKDNEPFRIFSFETNDVEVQGDVGWVTIDYQSAIRQFPTVPTRAATQIEKWRKAHGEWYPVPKNELVSYPETPSLRDAAAEIVLRARFEETWALRHASNWKDLYLLTDPMDHDFVTLDMYAESEGEFEYLDATVNWVEVIGSTGQVHVRYHHRVTDPSMEKLPSRDAIVTERWIRRDGQWYRDLKRK